MPRLRSDQKIINWSSSRAATDKAEHCVLVIKIAADLKFSRHAVYKLMKVAKGLPKRYYTEAKNWFWEETENVQ